MRYSYGDKILEGIHSEFEKVSNAFESVVQSGSSSHIYLQVGSGTISSGSNSKDITFAEEFDNNTTPVVIVQPKDIDANISKLKVSSVSNAGFTLTADANAAADFDFDYVAIGIKS